MKALIAGFGNSLYGDYAYGSEVAHVLETQEWPSQVHISNFGTQGAHVGIEMLQHYDLIIFIDVAWSGSAPGTLHIIEPEKFVNTIFDEHALELRSALAFVETIAAGVPAEQRPSIVIVACEPESTEEGAPMSKPVAAAIPAAVPIILKILATYGILAGIYAPV